MGGLLGGPWGAAIGAGVGLIGDFFSGKAASKEAQKQRDWQQYMSNTAHRREVRDLRLAGLNPILSATGGPGATTPSGAKADVPDYGSTAGRGFSSALQAAMLQANLDNINADTLAKEANAQLTRRTTENLPQPSIASARQNIEIAEIQSRIEKLRVEAAGGRTSNEILKGELRALAKEADAYLARVAPASYERKQLNDIVTGDMTFATGLKLLLQILGR